MCCSITQVPSIRKCILLPYLPDQYFQLPFPINLDSSSRCQRMIKHSHRHRLPVDTTSSLRRSQGTLEMMWSISNRHFLNTPCPGPTTTGRHRHPPITDSVPGRDQHTFLSSSPEVQPTSSTYPCDLREGRRLQGPVQPGENTFQVDLRFCC